MKNKVVKILFILVFLLGGIVVMQAQNQVILNFTGKNQNNDFVKLDSVFVENTTQRWQEVLYYPDTTLYIGTTGISDPSSEEINLHLCQNVPNPFDGVTEFSLQLPEKSDLTLEIYDLSGKLTATYKGTLEQGNHLFKAWVAVPQTYLLSAKSENGVARIKMVNVGSAGQNSIEYLGMGSTISIGNHIDDSKGGTLLPFTPGDWMKYIGYAQIADSYFESRQIVQKQYSSQDIELKFDIPLPVVTTLSATGILSSSATLHGHVTNQTAYSAINVGFDVADNVQMNNASRYDIGPSDGDFQHTVSDLQLYTQHFCRAFATTALGTEYGNVVSFFTLAELPEVTTDVVTDITATSASCSGQVTFEGGANVSVRGVCWSTSPNPTLADNFTNNGTGMGSFTGMMTALVPGTTYYVRAYATNVAGTAYGEQKTFTTLAVLPTVTTNAVSGITASTATCGGDVTYDGGANVIARGVCWSTSQNPTVSNSHTTNGSGTGSFTSSLTGLNPGTTYYVRAYATNSTGTAYGEQRSFTTLTTSPTVTTNTINNIMATSATCGGNVTATGGATVTSRGVCWSTSQNPTVSSSHTTNGSGMGSFTSNLTGLNPGTTYYVRAYATNSAGTAYGEQRSFTTSDTTPTVTTNTVNNITATSATCGGNVTATGGATVTTRGVCWSTSQNPTVYDSHTTDGSGTGSFTSSITGLAPGTTYYVRAYATNSVGTAYGAQRSFTTLAIPPTLTTDTIRDITALTAICGGNVTATGGANVTSRGVCWSTSQNPKVSNSHTTNGSGMGSFTSNLTGLNPGTTYFVRAYASNSAGTGYGEQRSFTTSDTTPTVTTNAVSNIMATTATCGGNVTSDGGATVTARGVCWSTSQNPTVNDSHTTDGSGTGSFTSSLTGLTEGTTYYVRAYATNSEGTAYGEQISFISGVTLPTVITNTVSDISSSTAISGGNVTNDGGATVTARGVCWSTSQNPTVSDSHTTDGSGTGSFTSSITGLTAGTTYYVRAYATNSAGTAYGEQRSFTTSANPPTVTTNTVSNITVNSATCGGNVTSDGGASVTARGVCWSTSQNPTVSGSHTTDGSGTGSFTSSITGLTAGTTYYVRAYATNSAGTAYGEQRSFTTSANPPTVTTNTVSNITVNSATCGGNVTSDGGATVTARGVCWSTSQNPTVSGSHTTDGSGTGSFTSSITGLTAGTTYYVRAYATNSAGTAYGEQRSFTTSANPPTVATNTVSNITVNSATCGGNVTSDGGANVTARGVCWSTSQNPTVSGSHTTDGSGTGSFTSSITGLTAGTTYYVRAYATNSAGTAYGEQRSFTTSANPPTVTTNTVSNITATTAACGGNVSSDGGATVTARGVCWSTSQNPTVSGSHTTDGSGTGSFTSSITGLTAGTTYYVRAYATNSAGTAYGEQRSCTTSSSSSPCDASDQCEYTFNLTDSYGDGWNGGSLSVQQNGVSVATITLSSGSAGTETVNLCNNIPASLVWTAGSYVSEVGFSIVDPNGNVLHTQSGMSNYTTYMFTPSCFVLVPASGSSTITTCDSWIYDNGGPSGNYQNNSNGYLVVTPSTPGQGISLEGTYSTESCCDHIYVYSGVGTSGTQLGSYSGSGSISLTHSGTVTISFYSDGSVVNTGFAIHATCNSGSSFSCGTSTVSDYDGNTYNTVQIGQQCWMKENLRTTHYSNGVSIPSGGSSTSYTNPYYYNYSSSSIALSQRGYLYNWPAVMHGASSSTTNPSGVQGICPTGWHVPSDAEWTQLTDYVSSQSQYVCGSNNTYIAKALASTTGWNSYSGSCYPGDQSVTANNATGFSAVPAGYCYGSSFDHAGYGANFWSSTQYSSTSTYAYYRYLYYNYTYVTRTDSYEGNGCSVRCLRDESGGGTASLPTVTTNTVSNITATTATCGGNVTATGGATVTARGVCWSTSQNPTVSNSHTTDGSGTGSFTSSITGLTAGTTYYVRAYATNSAGTAYGEQRSFTTSTPSSFTCGTSTVTDYDGNTYNTVQIGQQCWMKENLKTAHLNNGTYIPLVQDTVSWQQYSTPAYCYYNQTSYGCLYNFYAVQSGNLCPTGWHVPSYLEVFSTLYDALEGTSVGGKMKTTGTTYWASPNTGATNSSGFSGRAGGYRPSGHAIRETTLYGVFWTTTTYDNYELAYDYMLSYNNEYLSTYGLADYEYSMPKNNGLSVRCLRDDSGGGTASLPTVTTNTVSNIAATTATCGGNVTATGGATVTARGVCWSTSQNPTVSNSHTTEGSGTGSFTSNITGLTANTTYYVRAYATNSAGTAYGEQRSFTTNTNDFCYLLNESFDYGMPTTWTQIDANNDSYGWEHCSNPVSYFAAGTDLSGSGHNSSTGFVLSGSYSNVTGQAITPDNWLITPAITLTSNSDLSFWLCAQDASYAAEHYGVYITTGSGTTTSEFTLIYEETIDANGGSRTQGAWKQKTVNLSSYTGQTIRIAFRHFNCTDMFVLNLDDVSVSYDCNNGSADGQPCSAAPTVSDYDGNIYNTVQIGNQCWMKENLKTTHLNNGASIPLVQDTVAWQQYSTPAYCYYDKTSYGCLYNFYAVQGGNLCPTGWHVPSYSEVHSTLYNALEGTSVGGKMKTTGTTYWASPNTGATNSSGFSARAGGYRPSGYAIREVTLRGVFWTSTTYDNSDYELAYDYMLRYNSDNLLRYGMSAYDYSMLMNNGLSVRCLRDDSGGGTASLPTVTTNTVSNIAATTATCSGNVTSDGGANVTDRGVCWSTSQNPTVSNSHTTDGSGTGSFTSNITGLTAGTTYYVRAYATNSAGTAYGVQRSFTTNPSQNQSAQYWFNLIEDASNYYGVDPDAFAPPIQCDTNGLFPFSSGNSPVQFCSVGQVYNWNHQSWIDMYNYTGAPENVPNMPSVTSYSVDSIRMIYLYERGTNVAADVVDTIAISYIIGFDPDEDVCVMSSNSVPQFIMPVIPFNNTTFMASTTCMMTSGFTNTLDQSTIVYDKIPLTVEDETIDPESGEAMFFYLTLPTPVGLSNLTQKQMAIIVTFIPGCARTPISMIGTDLSTFRTVLYDDPREGYDGSWGTTEVLEDYQIGLFHDANNFKSNSYFYNVYQPNLFWNGNPKPWISLHIVCDDCETVNEP